MAYIDPIKQCLTVRIVFDGAPEAGKTATLEALARSVGEEVLTPEERDRRTLYFDWMEHTAGRFGGRPINCQVVTVPGQKSLFDRRESILMTADAVVFVVDSRPSELERAAEAISQCRAVLRAQVEPCELLVQANKQDYPGTLDPEQLVSEIGAADCPFAGTVADQGVGVREVFLNAVRLALARVRRLDATGSLKQYVIPRLASAQALYDGLDLGPQGEAEWSEGESKVGLRLSPFAKLNGLMNPGAASDQDPIDSIGEGLIWPPIEGRILVKLAQEDDVQWSLSPEGAHTGKGRAWFFAACSQPLDTVDQAREVLLEYAREHVRYRAVLSSDRCLTVLPSSDGCWQVWQIVKRRSSLHDLIDRTSWSGEPMEGAAGALNDSVKLAKQGIEAVQRYGSTIRVDLRNLGVEDSQVVVVGLFEFAPSGVSQGRLLAAELMTLCEDICPSLSPAAYEALLEQCGSSISELDAM